MPSSDTYIEKDSSVNEEIDRLRLRATSSLLERQDVIIVASVSSIYGLGSPKEYRDLLLILRKGEEYDRRNLLKQFVDMHYTRNDLEFPRGTFRVKGDVVEVHPAYEETAFRLDFFGDTLESIREINILTGENIEEREAVSIYPAKHFVTSQPNLERAMRTIREELDERTAELKARGNLLEAQRLELLLAELAGQTAAHLVAELVDVLGLELEAQRAKVKILTGWGNSPGLTQLLARQGYNQVTRPYRVNVHWCGGSDESVGPSNLVHLFHIFNGTTLQTFGGKEMRVETGSGRKVVDFPAPIGRTAVYYTGHAESVSLPRNLPGLEEVTLHGGTKPEYIVKLLRGMSRLRLLDTHRRRVVLARFFHRIEGWFASAGIDKSVGRVEVYGRGEDAVQVKVFTYVGHIAEITSYPAYLAARWLVDGKLDDKPGGVYAAERLLDDPTAFLAGLLANYNHGKEYFHKTLHAMDIKIESLAKPIIFMMVGPFVALSDLWDTALLGLLVSLVFILVARPVAVMLSLLPTNLSMKDKLFMSIVRETGVIPVVLAVVMNITLERSKASSR